jgi:hypothetical protein
MRGSWHAETLSSHNCQFSTIYEQIIFLSDPVFSKLPKIDTLKQWKTYSSNDTFSEIELLLARNHYIVLRKYLIEQNRTLLALYNYHTKQTQKRKKPGLKILNLIQPH